MPTATVTFNGRVTLPSHVRKELGLKTGDTVDFIEVERGRFSILPVPGSIDGARAWAKLDRDASTDEIDELVH